MTQLITTPDLNWILLVIYLLVIVSIVLVFIWWWIDRETKIKEEDQTDFNKMKNDMEIKLEEAEEVAKKIKQETRAKVEAYIEEVDGTLVALKCPEGLPIDQKKVELLKQVGNDQN